MNGYWRMELALLTALLTAGLRLTAFAAGEAQGKELNILIFGSSAFHGVIDDLPEIAKANGDAAYVRCLRAAPLSKYWESVQVAEATPDDSKAFVSLETDYKAKVRVKDELTSNKWDVIVLHQFSSLSLNPEAFRTDARNLFDYVKKYQPEARILFNENSSDRGDGIRNTGAKNAVAIKPPAHRGKGFTYDMAAMYEDIHKAARQVAEELGIGIIPVGYAVSLAEKHPLWGYQFPDPAFDYENAQPPAKPKNKNSLWIGASWSKDKKTGADFLFIDNHKNNAGRYLQGAVYYEVFFGKSVFGNTYVPAGKIVTGSDVDYSANIPLGAQEVRALQQIAHEAVDVFYPGAAR